MNAASSDLCEACPVRSSSPIASDNLADCICDAGSTGPDGMDCVQCVAGKYKIVT